MRQEALSPTDMKRNDGFGLVEIIVAMGLFAVIATTGVVSVIGSFQTNRLGDEHTRAAIYAQEGIEAMRSIRAQGWDDPFLTINCSGGCGVDSGVGMWAIAGASNTLDGFTRTVAVSDVLRSAADDIVDSGGTVDVNTKKITSTVTWDFSPTRSNSLEMATYLTNFAKAIGAGWSSPSELGNLNLPGKGDGYKVQASGNYMYIITFQENPSFFAVDVSTPSTPTIASSLSFVKKLHNLFIVGDYAYVVSSSNSQELQIIDISNPAAVNLLGTLNMPGNRNANSIYVVDTIAYITRIGGLDFAIADVSNPLAPTLLGQLNLAQSAGEVVVSGSYAYITTRIDGGELQIVDVSNTSSPSVAASLNLAGNDDATAISIVGSNVYVAQGNNLHAIDISSPTSPVLLGSYDAGDVINDISLDSPDDIYLFLATSSNSQQMQAINIQNPAAMILAGSVSLSGGGNLLGVAYSQSLNIVGGASSSNNEELTIFSP